MAYPFGGHPTLKDYIGWCNLQGCTTRSGFSHDGVTMCTRYILEAPSGRHVIITGIGMSEHLVPTYVAYLDRRLGLDSPFAKIGSGDEEA